MKRLLILAMCLILMGIGTSFAEVAPKHAFELGPEIYYDIYKEAGVMKESGMMYGLFGSYTYHNQKNLMLRAELRGSGGLLDYKNSGKLGDIPDLSIEFRGLAGLDFNTTQTITLTPYAGIGYRYLNDDSSGEVTTTGEAGYDRESNYLYLPIGVEGKIQMGEEWSITPAAEFDIFLFGRQISHLSDANLGYGDVDNDQNEGYGVRGSVRFMKTGKKMDLIIEPFIRYWNIAKSNDSLVTYAGVIIGYGYEPQNTTTECGLKIGVKF